MIQNVWTDVHTHLNMLKISAKEAVQNAQNAGVKHIITIGTAPKDWPQVLQLTKTFPTVKGALGVHPHHAQLYNNEVEQTLAQCLSEKDIIACGEIGLDYYYEHSPKKIQREVFYRQLVLSVEKNLPVEIHTRSAEEDTYSILKEFKGKACGLLHCFTGTWNLAKKALELGFNISFSGIITFKNTTDLRELCQKIPLNRLHLETDAPYLAPVPHRGKPNQPSWLIHTAYVMAHVKQVPIKELSEITQTNFKALFQNKIPLKSL